MIPRKILGWSLAGVVGLALAAIVPVKGQDATTRPAATQGDIVAALGIDQGINVPVTTMGVNLGPAINALAVNIAAHQNAATEVWTNEVEKGRHSFEVETGMDGKEKGIPKLGEALAALAGKNPRFEVILTADASTPFEKLALVLNECAAAHVWRVDFATRASQKGELQFVSDEMSRQQKGDETPNTLAVAIESVAGKDGTETFQGKVGHEEEYIGADAFLAELTKQRQQMIAAGIKPEDLRCVIYPQAETRYEQVLVGYEMATKAGFDFIGFGVQK